MTIHIIILYALCAGLIFWQFMSINHEEKVVKTIKALSDRIKRLEEGRMVEISNDNL